MAGPATITIGRQVLDVELRGTELDGVALHQRLPALAAALAPVVEDAFGPVDTRDVHLSIDRLALDLGTIDLGGGVDAGAVDGLDAHLTARLVDALRREVGDHVRRIMAWTGEVAPVGAPAGPLDGSPDGSVRRRSVAQTLDDALVVFLRTGRLPWSYRLPAGADLGALVAAAWATGPGGAPPPATVAELRSVLREPVARRRLVAQLSPSFAARVLGHLEPELAAEVQLVVAAVEAPAVTSPRRAAFTRGLWDRALGAAADGRTAGAGELASEAWRAAGSGPVPPGPDPLADALERQWPGTTARAGAPPPEAAPARPTVTTPAERIPALLADGDAAIAVENAGIVLLHPFLVRFLDGLGLVAGDDLTDPNRALCLLHHLVTGELTAPEHQLTLAKVLCGVPLDEPVDADVGLTTDEVTEAAALLSAVVSHWEALRNTSPGTLRVEFLMRPGSLSVDAFGDWLLRVEARTVDILLDELPWGASAVKLPWMAHLLKVEWR